MIKFVALEIQDKQRLNEVITRCETKGVEFVKLEGVCNTLAVAEDKVSEVLYDSVLERIKSVMDVQGIALRTLTASEVDQVIYKYPEYL